MTESFNLFFPLFSWQCYLFHMYVGVRAGGGIGDELEDPAGDPYELYRILFDITFFFFVIVILLAIIQGTHTFLGGQQHRLYMFMCYHKKQKRNRKFDTKLISIHCQVHNHFFFIPSVLDNSLIVVLCVLLHSFRFDHWRFWWAERPAGAGEGGHGGKTNITAAKQVFSLTSRLVCISV